MSNSTNDALFDFKFYEWEKDHSNQWEEYTKGQMV